MASWSSSRLELLPHQIKFELKIVKLMTKQKQPTADHCCYEGFKKKERERRERTTEAVSEFRLSNLRPKNSRI